MWYFDSLESDKQLISDQSAGDQTRNSDVIELPADIALALEALVQSIESGDDQVAPFFVVNEPLIAGRAPGRLDVMGGIADYSGSTVLQLPLQESTIVFCQRYREPVFRVVAQCVEQTMGESRVVTQVFSMPMKAFFEPSSGLACNEQHMHDYFAAIPDEHQWAAYVAGVLTVLLLSDVCIDTDGRGIVLHVSSTVPVGKGVSSSAALEVATMRALSAMFGLNISAHEQALLCQRVENHIVGAPCGLMDQMASSCAERGTLLNMLCQPDVINEAVVLHDGLSLWAIDSGIRHAVSGADYGSVRVAAFMGYRYILEAAGIADNSVPAASVKDTRWHGYLANVSVHDFLQHYESTLPLQISGAQFLKRFDATTDIVTRVDPGIVYCVRACTAHPIHEHFRARLFRQLATTGKTMDNPEPLAIMMGECMYQSHASYSNCGLDSEGTDTLVEKLRAAGVAEGIYGARITGGGSGGAVAVLARTDADSTIRSIAADYAANSGVGGYVFSGSSDGAGVFYLSASAAG